MNAENLDLLDDHPVNFSLLVHRLSRVGKIKIFMQEIAKEWIAPNEILEVNTKNNTVRSLTENKDYVHYHAVCEKSKPVFHWPQWGMIPECYYVTREGFWKKSDQITSSAILYRKAKGLLTRLSRAIRWRLLRFIAR